MTPREVGLLYGDTFPFSFINSIYEKRGMHVNYLTKVDIHLNYRTFKYYCIRNHSSFGHCKTIKIGIMLVLVLVTGSYLFLFQDQSIVNALRKVRIIAINVYN